RVLDELGVPIRILGAEPLTEMHGDVRLSLLHPQPPGGRSFYPHLEANDNSLVLKVIYRDFSLLLTGDVEAAAEKMLVERRFGSLKSTVLKVPHHGSSTSSSESFLRAVGPTLAVAQCADRGRFAFPKPEVEARYRRLGIPLWITGRHGALQISTDGGRFIRRDWF
ncbi:MAG: competence protein ComEC, partial [Myxococcota bacterium]